MSRPRGLCPYCGAEVSIRGGLTAYHHEQGAPPPGSFVTRTNSCPGSRQNGLARGDRRPTWRDEDRAGTKWDPWSPDYDPHLWRVAP